MTDHLCNQVHHGGQAMYTQQTPVELDMSVTTNSMGPLKSFHFDVTKVDHYPPINDVEMQEQWRTFHQVRDKEVNVLFGNGATELIDLLIRSLSFKTWTINNVETQYKEYEYACHRKGVSVQRVIQNKADLTIVINPNNPTGEFLTWQEMKEFVNTKVPEGGILIVDESMLFWNGNNWKSNSFLGHLDDVRVWRQEKDIQLFIIQSWTKIFACTGLRIGSLVTFYNREHTLHLEKMRPPWYLNIIGRQYILHCWKEGQHYLKLTWKLTKEWNTTLRQQLKSMFPKWTLHGENWLSWIWVDCHCEQTAQKIVQFSTKIGFPVRDGSLGYNKPTCFRMRVHDPMTITKWFDAVSFLQTNQWETTLPFSNELVIKVHMVHVDSILTHENFVESNVARLLEYCQTNGVVMTSILVTKENVLIDGHHRLEVLKRLGFTYVPVSVIKYHHNSVLTHPNTKLAISKSEIIQRAKSRHHFEPKTTQHVITVQMGENSPIKFIPIVVLGKVFAVSNLPSCS